MVLRVSKAKFSDQISPRFTDIGGFANSLLIEPFSKPITNLKSRVSSEIYYISFIKPFEVQIEIAKDLKDIAKRLYSNVSEQKGWIQKTIDSTILTLKNDLKKILTIIRRSKRTNKISVLFKSWTEEIPAIFLL